ncbi:MAG: TylF/MycF/NovP-related O-methyltransferase [Halioglobus sp.]
MTFSANDSEVNELFARALSLISSDQSGEAKLVCQKLVELAWTDEEVERLADLQAQLKMWGPAAKTYIEAIAENPKVARLHRKLADLQRRSGDLAGASLTYRRATEIEQAAILEKGTNHLSESTRQQPSPYLELLKRCLTFELWDASDGSLYELNVSQPIVSIVRLIQRIKHKLNPPPATEREFGRDWPSRALTMVGSSRLDNVQLCVERVLEENIPGDLIETGVWRGGCTIFMRALLETYADPHRTVWVADSFSGMPKPNSEKYPADRRFDLSMWRSLSVSADEVRANFARFGLLDNRVKFLEGFFSETLPSAPIEQLAIMRLDGDLYESTIDSLNYLYPKLSSGGFVIIDDFFCSAPCKQAVDDYREKHNISGEMLAVDWSAVYWRKE